MLDNQLFQLLIPIIRDGLTAQGFNSIPVKQANQPTQQGANTVNTIYLSKLYSNPLGFLKRSNAWDEGQQVMVHTEKQDFETAFQLNAFALQNAADINSATASDLLRAAWFVLQGDAARAALKASNVGIYRIPNLAGVYSLNDMDNFEASPSFDFSVTHTQSVITTSPVLSEININVYQVL